MTLRPGWEWREAGPANRPQTLSAALLQDFCREQGLTPYKLPRHFACLAELPRNTGGKVVKPAVRQALLSSQAVRRAAL